MCPVRSSRDPRCCSPVVGCPDILDQQVATTSLSAHVDYKKRLQHKPLIASCVVMKMGVKANLHRPAMKLTMQRAGSFTSCAPEHFAAFLNVCRSGFQV